MMLTTFMQISIQITNTLELVQESERRRQAELGVVGPQSFKLQLHGQFPLSGPNTKLILGDATTGESTVNLSVFFVPPC